MDAVTIARQAERLAMKYDGDHDTMPGLPLITYTDYQVIELLVHLAKRVDELERAILEKAINEY